MLRLLEKRPILTIIVVAILLLLPNLNALEVSIMEARNFISAREMLTDGNWILTTLNGEARYQKPPLPTWLTAISALVFGIKNIWALRLPAALMVVFLGIGIFKLSRKLNLHNSQSLITGLVAITSLYTILIIFEAPWDIYAHTFMLWSIYFLVCWFKKEKVLRSGVLFIVFLVASILSKGPVSLYVLFLSFLVAYFVNFRDVLNARRVGYLFGLVLLGLLVGFSWYGYVRFVDPDTFVKITAKETSNWSSYNVRPFYYYWSFFVQSGIWTIPAFVSLLYPYLKKRVSNGKEYKFAVLWVLVAVVLLSVIPEKKSRYLMPVLIPLSLTVGFYIKYLIDHFKTIRDWREKVPVYFHFGLIGVALVLGIIVFMMTSAFIPMAWYGYPFLVVSMIIGVLILKHLFLKKNTVLAFYCIILGVVMFSLGYATLPKNTIKNKNYKSFKDVQNLNDLPLYGYRMTMPEMIWEYGRVLPRLDSLDLKLNSLQSKFMVLECSSCNYTLEQDFKNYNLFLKDSIDLNKDSYGDNNYRARKKSRIYLASKK